MSLKDLAKQAGINTKKEQPKKEQPKKEQPKEEGKVADLVKKEKKERITVNDDWVATLTEKANKNFGNLEEFGNAKVEFTIAKSKGRYVSLTPKLVYEDGLIKSAGVKHRVGFCTNQQWDSWLDKLKKALVVANTTERKTPTRKNKSRWATYLSALEGLEGITHRPMSNRLSIKDNEGSKLTLRMDEDDVVKVSSAKGSIDFAIQVLTALKSK